MVFVQLLYIMLMNVFFNAYECFCLMLMNVFFNAYECFFNAYECFFNAYECFFNAYECFFNAYECFFNAYECFFNAYECFFNAYECFFNAYECFFNAYECFLMLMNVFFDGYEWLLHGYYIVVTWSSMVITNVMTMSWSDSDPLAILENFTYSELWPGGGQCNWLHARSLLAVFTRNHQFCLLSSSTGHNKTTNLDILCIYI